MTVEVKRGMRSTYIHHRAEVYDATVREHGEEAAPRLTQFPHRVLELRPHTCVVYAARSVAPPQSPAAVCPSSGTTARTDCAKLSLRPASVVSTRPLNGEFRLKHIMTGNTKNGNVTWQSQHTAVHQQR